MFTGNKSFRAARDTELIKFGKPSTKITMDFFSQGRNQNSALEFSTQGRQICLNSVRKPTLTSLLGTINAVVFYPDHLSLIKGSPAERRRFLDTAIFQTNPLYAKIVSNYNKVLQQRNALIKDIYKHSELLDTLFIWDQKLSSYAGEIIYQRLEYIKLLHSVSKKHYFGISNQTENLKIEYSSDFINDIERSKQELSKKIFKSLQEKRKEDLSLGFTTVGPHRDDIDFLIDEKSAKKFASQGQQRSIVLALKLAEATVLKEKTKNPPVILLDDVMSELDISRQNYILNCIKDWQVFITSCEESTIMRLVKGKTFKIKKGVLIES